MALMYGGDLEPIANVTYDSHTPAAAFASEEFANLFFRCAPAPARAAAGGAATGIPPPPPQYRQR